MPDITNRNPSARERRTEPAVNRNPQYASYAAAVRNAQTAKPRKNKRYGNAKRVRQRCAHE